MTATVEPFEVAWSAGFGDWLAHQQVSLAFTTYQSSKLFFVGRSQDGAPALSECVHPRCMGLWGDGQTLWLSTLFQLWRLENALNPGQLVGVNDRLYVPRVGYTIGNLDVHDVVVESSGRVVFAVTSFNCLATVSERYNFAPLWRPPFVSALVKEDRCHLNGIALDEGAVHYVTLVSRCDVADGWRDHRRDGGCILEVSSGRVVLDGLSMPHSPRVHAGQLWVLDSGTGRLGRVDRTHGRFELLAFCPGYLRGLAFAGNYAVVGLSRPRHDKNFGGLELETNLIAKGAQPRCGLSVIDLRSGEESHWLRIEGGVRELYDVIVLPEVLRPAALGVTFEELRRIIAVG
ncbi:MAG TPA: TIGR03032 family protein [Gemmataceae bacterium]|nr:TIGR03032 family protein [Gemmataceae bacterium]